MHMLLFIFHMMIINYSEIHIDYVDIYFNPSPSELKKLKKTKLKFSISV